MSGRIASARAAVMSWSQAWLSLRRTALDGPTSQAPDVSWENVDTVIGDTGLAMTPAQAPAFFARSAAWRCTSCGKVHAFLQKVPVALASPCSCASIEFEPHREVIFFSEPERLVAYSPS